jgi:hypothetical protein
MPVSRFPRLVVVAGASISLVAALAVFAASCGKPASAQEPGRYYAGFWDGFSIKFPEDWEVKEDFMDTQVIALSPVKGGKDIYQENVAVVYEFVPPGVSEEEYLNLSLQQMHQMLQGLKVDKQGEMTIADRPAHWVTFSHEYMGVGMKGIGYIVVKGSRAYVIVCSATTKTFGRYRKTFDEVAESFRFE